MHSVPSSGEPPLGHQMLCCLPHMPRGPDLWIYGTGVGQKGLLCVYVGLTSGADGCQGCTLRSMSSEGI